MKTERVFKKFQAIQFTLNTQREKESNCFVFQTWF